MEEEVRPDIGLGLADRPAEITTALEMLGEKVKPGTLGILRASEGLITPAIDFPKAVECEIDGRHFILEYDAREANQKERSFNHVFIATLRLVDPLANYPEVGVQGIDVRLQPHEVGLREILFSKVKNSIIISASVLSRGKTTNTPEFQDLGIGTGLTLLNNVIIRDVLGKFGIDDGTESVYAEITDIASGFTGSGVKRKGWSSHVARLLGYREISRNGLIKWRYDFV